MMRRRLESGWAATSVERLEPAPQLFRELNGRPKTSPFSATPGEADGPTLCGNRAKTALEAEQEAPAVGRAGWLKMSQLPAAPENMLGPRGHIVVR